MSEEVNLIDLSDDVIIKIFSHLPFTDLLAVRGICQRFRQLAHETFHLYPKKVVLTLRENIEYDPFVGLETLLNTLGQDIKELSFIGLKDPITSHRFLDLFVANICSSKLKCLKLVKVALEMNDAVRCTQILKNLEAIELFECTAAHIGVFEGFLTRCEQLKDLTAVNLLGLDGHWLRFFLGRLSTQLESLNLQHLRTFNGNLPQFSLNIGSRTKRLILRHVAAEITCTSKDLSNMETLKLDLVTKVGWYGNLHDHGTSIGLLAYTSNKLKHLHLSNVMSNGEEISKIGNQLEFFSLEKSKNIRGEYVYKLLENNPNLRSVKICHMGYDGLYEEVPKRIPNIEELCIWPDLRLPGPYSSYFAIGPLDGILMLKKLKSFTFFCSRFQTSDCIEQLAQMDSLESLGFPIDAKDFNQYFDKQLRGHFFKMKNLKSLKLALNGNLNTSGYEKLGLYFGNLKELKIVHGNVMVEEKDDENEYDGKYSVEECHDFTLCDNCACGPRGINECELSQFIKFRQPIMKSMKKRTPLKIYQTEKHHRHSLSDKVVVRKLQDKSCQDMLRLLSLSNDGFFEFFAE